MQARRYNQFTEFPSSEVINTITGEILPSPGDSLGIYADKVANSEAQAVKEKPLRSRLHKIRAEIRNRNLASQRVCDCGYKPLGSHVEVHFNREHHSAKVAGLETCGSVWACPVCRTKIMSGRADELRQIGEGFREDGGRTSMITLTVPHYRGQALSTILGTHKTKKGLAGAFARMRAHRQWRELKDVIGYVADTRAIEVTHGRNGYHAHVHMLIYYNSAVDITELENRVYRLWASVCESAGLERPSTSHGVRVTEGDGEYLAKWGAPCELTSQAHKQAKNGNQTIAELEAMLNADAAHQAEPVLREYYAAMHGRKLLTWGGKNLRKEYLDVPDMTDEEHAQDEHGDGERLYILPFLVWKQIYYTNQVGQFLSMIEADTETGLFTFCRQHGIKTGGVVRTYKDVPAVADVNTKITELLNN